MPISIAMLLACLTLATATFAPALQDVQVRAIVHERCSKVVIEQSYFNKYSLPLEICTSIVVAFFAGWLAYTFPVDPNAAIGSFEADIGSKHISAVVKEKQKASREYTAAVEAGSTAIFFKSHHPGLFTASLGNLASGEKAVLRIEYVSELELEGDAYRFVIPTTLTTPYQMTGTTANHELPSIVHQADEQLKFSVKAEFHMLSPSVEAESPSHSIRMRVNGSSVYAEMSQASPLNEAFVMLIRSANVDTPRALITFNDAGDRVAMVNFVAPQNSEIVPTEVIFVIDDSRSMAGEPVQSVRNLMPLLLRSLPLNSRFNIYIFGSWFEKVFEEAVSFSQETLLIAVQACHDKLHASHGGTEMLQAMRDIYSRKVGSAGRNIVLLTDGAVNDPDAVIALVRRTPHSRVFTFGIGRGVSEHLVRGMAAAGNGYAEFVVQNTDLMPDVMRQLAKVLSPPIENLVLEFGSLPVKHSVPSKPPVIFPGAHSISYLFLGDGVVNDGTVVKLRGTQNGREFLAEAPIYFHNEPTTMMHSLAARAHIRELETQLGINGNDTSLREEIVSWSTRHGVVSTLTAFVAVLDHNDTTEAQECQEHHQQRLREHVPLQPPAGVASSLSSAGSLGSMQSFSVYATAASLMVRSFNFVETGKTVGTLAATSHAIDLNHTPHEAIELFKADEQQQAVMTLLNLQRFNGSFSLDEQLANALGKELSDLESSKPDNVSDDQWATKLVLCVLESRFAELEYLWRFAASKAALWEAVQRISVSKDVAMQAVAL